MKMISAILLASAIWAVCAEERIKYAASDGVNEVTARVTDSGVVVPESVTTAYVEPSPPYIPQSGEHCVIADVEYVLITAQDWAAMKYQLCRFDNMTNYVEEIGGSNDCARVLLRLHDRGEELASSNSVLLAGLKSERLNTAVAVQRAQEYADAYADATNRAASVLALFTAATNRAAVAEAKVARTEAFKAWLAGQRDNAMLPSTKAIYQAIIDRLEEN